MEVQKPKFSESGWDFVVFPLALVLSGISLFLPTPVFSILFPIFGIIGLAIRQRNTDIWNRRHEFKDRIPGGSKWNFTFVLMLMTFLVSRITWLVVTHV